jgi:hypothetical protein
MRDTLGQRLISELGRRGQLGYYFDYGGYQKLRRIDSADELERFLLSLGYYGTWDVADESAMADQLAEQETERVINGMKRNPLHWFGCFGILYPMWLLSRFFRR